MLRNGRTIVVSALAFSAFACGAQTSTPTTPSAPIAPPSPPPTSFTVYVSPAPFSGEIGAIAHEVCHAHQGRVTRDASLGSYYDTAEGRDFIQTTGWRFENGQWIEKCEPGWCGYPNPLEDSAQTCATYYDPGHSWAQDSLSRMAPIRNAWAMRWLSK